MAFWFIVGFGYSATGQKVDWPTIVREYINTYREIAIKEMMVYRVPASITMAQGIIESNAGQSKLATEANNHFGIKCHKDWFGKTYYMDDDHRDECFRKYGNPEESFRDHSYFLTQRERYKKLFELDVTDYKGWAFGLKAAGYATNPDYAQMLINAIERYDLARLDAADFTGPFGKEQTNLEEDFSNLEWVERFMVVGKGPNNRKLFSNNDLMLTISRKGDSMESLSRDFDISPKRLMRYNDLAGVTLVEPGQIIYLEPKRRAGAATAHVLKSGESLYHLSQLYGIKLKMIYKRNNLEEGSSIPAGKVLLLR